MSGRRSRGSSGWSVAQACRSVVIVVTSLASGSEPLAPVDVLLVEQTRGARQTHRMSAAPSAPIADALVVVDVQRGLVEGPHAVASARAFLGRWRHAADAARAAGVPVVHLQDAGRDPGSRIPEGSPGWELVLDVGAGEPVVPKEEDDGFDGTALDELLRSRGATRLCLVGIQSEMCVAGTARGALSRGYEVVLARDAHTTYDVPPDGDAPAVPAALVSRVAEWSLGDEVVAPGRLEDVVFVRPAAAVAG